jgi:hypothetical protein
MGNSYCFICMHALHNMHIYTYTCVSCTNGTLPPASITGTTGPNCLINFVLGRLEVDLTKELKEALYVSCYQAPTCYIRIKS